MKKKSGQRTKSLINFESINRDLQQQIIKRKATEETLIKFQRLYDTMVHNFPDGVIGVLNREMKYVLIDGKDLNEIDFPALGLVGNKQSDPQDPLLAEETLSKIKMAFEGQTISFEVKAKDRFYDVTAAPLPDSQNRINEIVCVLKNVTDKKRIANTLQEALEQERKLSELKNRFVTMACHEFKTPLATIQSSAFLLENYSGQDYETEKIVHTNRIRRSVNNLNMILSEFLTLEKLEGNRVVVVNTMINIPKYLTEIISEVEQIRDKPNMIEYRHLGCKNTAFLDAHLLWSIIANLISNAFKYSGETERIFITSEIQDGMTTIKVRDTGIGIPIDEHQYIFDRFFRARNAENFEGTGLGLHIVEKNVKLFNGSIFFTSKVGSGTEFTVILPDGGSEIEV